MSSGEEAFRNLEIELTDTLKHHRQRNPRIISPLTAARIRISIVVFRRLRNRSRRLQVDLYVEGLHNRVVRVVNGLIDSDREHLSQCISA